MTVQSVIQQVCPFVGVNVPTTSVFSAGNPEFRTMQEMTALATEMAQRIAYDTRDWTALRKEVNYFGNGTQTAFDLPTDYKRMLLNSNVWRSTSTQNPMRFIADSDEWKQRRLAQETDARGEWTMKGGQMHIFPAMGVGVSATFDYLEKNCIALAGPPASVGEVFVADNDRFRLDERLLKLGMIWQWKAHKGSPYAEDMGTYSDAIVNDMGHDQPAPIIIGRMPLSANARVSTSWPAGWGPQP